LVKPYLLLAGFFVATASTQAQTLEKLNASFDGEKMVVTYGLAYADANQKFKVALYSSHDNYKQPILVTGDAGENVLPGTAKRVVWEAKRVLPADFDGDIQIKIKTSRVVAPKLIIAPLALKTYKRGRTISMKWTGGFTTDKMKIELIKNNVVDQLVVDKMENKAAYEWAMPKSVKGRNYTLRITNSARPNEAAESVPFRVKPRIPFLVKILPILAGGAAYVFFSGAEATPEPGPGQTGDETLPGPVKPN
jgi:hypothetical protein